MKVTDSQRTLRIQQETPGNLDRLTGGIGPRGSGAAVARPVVLGPSPATWVESIRIPASYCGGGWT